jgi:nitrate reductase (cytochrome)
MSINRRKFLELSAAASALGAIGTQVPLAQAFSAQGGGSTNWVKSVCRYCGTGCGLFIGVQDGKVVSVRGDKENHNRGLLCLKGAVLPQIMQAPDRLLHPMVRKSGKLVQVSWDEAMDVVAGKFKESISKFGPESVAFYGSGQGLTEET